ncbi:PREDICTED: tumor protein p63-regulated gene 1 protein [Galeopterus variegatus]|uniref:Tumor protein p63-regulated gene 1 protein n=1 Tax=Galeopterus variegatus TaxID=482537 RepID=A0ABM0RCG8_GALVR|nr:PREDICTED: tumor protein p63-regulated gene 1 protein [Galeopterus variegatus]
MLKGTCCPLSICKAEEMAAIGSFEGFQPVSLKQEGDDQPSETDHLSMEEGDPGKEPVPGQLSRQSSVTKSTLYPNPYQQPYISRKYFVARPGAIETAMEDLKSHVVETSGETIQGFWLLTEIDHWNNEKERILLVTDKTLLICKYDFIMLSCVQLQRIPLSAIYRICLGKFVFPGMSLDKRQGEGLRIYWGSPEEQSLLSRWNPWSTEVPYATFTEHPMKYTSEKFLEICKLSGAVLSTILPSLSMTSQVVSSIGYWIDLLFSSGCFRPYTKRLKPVARRLGKPAQLRNVGLQNSTGSGRGKKLTVLTEPILINTYTGLMSFIGNRNKLGYSLARGSIGF